MIKKVPYNSNLISIGNAPHYEGQYVYSDGRVAYGWQYMNQYIPPTYIKRESALGGIFTNTWTNPTHTGEYYRDGNKMLLLADDLTWSVTGDAQGFEEYFYGTMYYYCYPWLADYNAKRMFTHDKSYNYVGHYILAMDTNGNMLTFESEWDDTLGGYSSKLHNYNADGDDVVTNLNAYDYDYCDYFLLNINNYYNPRSFDSMSIWPPFQLSTVNGAYLTRAVPLGNLPVSVSFRWWYDEEKPDPDISPEDYYIFWTYNDNNGEYTNYLPATLTMYFDYELTLYVNNDFYLYVISKNDLPQEVFAKWFRDLKVPLNTNSYEHYYCGNGSVNRVVSLPSTLTLSPNVTMRLSDLGLTVNKNNNTVTYANDPLGLLPHLDNSISERNTFIHPNRVYAYNDIVLCAQPGRAYNNSNGFVWRDGNRYTNNDDVYTNITSCYAASWIPDGKWIV